MDLDHGKRYVYFDRVLQREVTGFFIESSFSTLYGERCAVFRQSLGPEANDRTAVPHSSIMYIREAAREQPRSTSSPTGNSATCSPDWSS
ncbi:hypothetical protein EF910_05465 [Streptomyces sp. WAC07149]|uniref:hypothetical protein n=1 Tax=Streptomyces sp. WAC07149 TaxID=2487425 RepID=UPI000F7810E8|nr:hypothetical protein [Streptomyces sp. WAC07149]RST07885.1 hypothetical protein EF910_05465 [Streptomyces sp. WAC07149]